MELCDVKHVSTKGGALRYMIQPTGSARPVNKVVVAVYIKEEKEMGLYGRGLFADFTRKWKN
jgi:hypothetical protein